MSSIRQSKVSRLLQKELGQIFQTTVSNWFPNTMLSVTIVRVTPDLGYAKIYLSVFGNMEPKECVEIVNENISKIRGELGNRVGKQLRIVPELKCFVDDSIDYAEEIENLLK